MANQPKLHSHRLIKDGSFDVTCFATGGGYKPEGEPAENSTAHVCDSSFLAERGIFTQTEITLQAGATQPGANNRRGKAAQKSRSPFIKPVQDVHRMPLSTRP